MKLALAAYQPQWHASWSAFCEKVTNWVETAVSEGGELLVFPEYAGLEAALIGPVQERSMADWITLATQAEAPYLTLLGDLAARHNVHILSGSGPAVAEQGHVNRAWLIGPQGRVKQDKLIPTPYERTEMGLVGGQEIACIDTALGRIGILICYDSEFPLLARDLAEAGVEVILVPSCTDFPAGQTRVRQSCRARAIEQQCLVVQAPLVGAVEACEVIDQNTGRAGAFCPPDHGLPADGIVAQGPVDFAGWTYVEADPAAISAPRKSGQVGNFAHWAEQTGPKPRVTNHTIA